MAEIRSTGFAGGDIVTTHQPPESIRDWVNRHADAYKQGTVSGDILDTYWPGKPEPCWWGSTRLPGESDADFHARHWADVTTNMTQCPPVTD